MTIIPNENEEIEFKEKEQFELPVFTEQQAREDEFEKETGMKYEMVEDKETGEWQ